MAIIRPMEKLSETAILNALSHYDFGTEKPAYRPLGSGQINDTLLIQGKEKRYLLQRINTFVFKDPEGLMDNIARVTAHIKKKVEARHGDVSREILTVFPAKDGALYYQDEEGNAFRALHFIEGASTYDAVKDPALFYEAGKAFGRFQSDLSDFPAESLIETIPHFHDTPARYQAFLKAMEENKAGRKASILPFLEELIAHKEIAERLADLVKQGKMPLRVTHNDTKLNNVMIDDATHQGLAPIDLDTVMPGLAAFDFGDAVRYGANTAAEDEPDLTKVGVDIPLFQAFAKGFVKGTDGRLTDIEMDHLVDGAETMAYELCLRFITDYLDGDLYFKTTHPEHNLERAKCQFALYQAFVKEEEALRLAIKEMRK